MEYYGRNIYNILGGEDMLPLGLINTGEEAEIVKIGPDKNPCNSFCERIEDMGLRAGKIIEMLSNEGRGPILLKVDESRIAIGRGMAMKIMVKKINSQDSGVKS